MSTETVSYSSSRSHRLIAILFALLVSITVLGGIGTRRQDASSVPVSRIDAAQSTRYPQKMMAVGSPGSGFAGAAQLLSPTPTGTPPPESLSPFTPPDVIQPTAATTALRCAQKDALLSKLILTYASTFE
jgi:hypothetical protein